MASSSALKLGDVALTWSNVTVDSDLSIIDLDLASDRGFTTAVLLSLFTDRRAEADDQPPSGDSEDRRGWWADQFATVDGDRMGSRLWLLDRAKSGNETKRRAEEYVRESLAWMIADRVVSRIDVTVELTKAAMLISIGLNRPGRDQVQLHFGHIWDNLQGST